MYMHCEMIYAVIYIMFAFAKVRECVCEHVCVSLTTHITLLFILYYNVQHLKHACTLHESLTYLSHNIDVSYSWWTVEVTCRGLYVHVCV